MAAALPAAGVGALIGGHVGGNIGLGLGGVVSVPLPPPLPVGVVVPTTVAGTAIGAAIAAAVAGGIGGAAAGAAVGAGDTLAEPRVIDIPDLPEHDLDGITNQVSEQIAAAPEPVAQAVTATVEAAPQFVEDVTNQAVAAREVVLAQPGGDQVISALDAAAAEAQLAFGPTAEWIGEALGAAQSGVTEA
ncbi:hypothetical protein [Prescottella subtropica]|uniref:hypothetical protein n=1 Tax=Prescottella subtropica TaxID=2545757 RepID=UPI0010F8AA21|nr:hypothetical protein [Prescottella subtropica]